MRVIVGGGLVLISICPTFAEAPYARAGWFTDLSTLAHGVSGRATIVDEDTFRIDNFHYDGGGISVYAYLGASDANPDFAAGLETGPQLLGMVFTGQSLIVDLPIGHTLDGYNAVSIWCVVAGTSFGSGTFAPPPYPRAGFTATLPPGSHSTHGVATIVDDRTLRLDNFYYDGLAPAVYVNLGVDSTNQSFEDGAWIGPQLVTAYNDDTLTVQFPEDQTLSGFGAVCIWCEVIHMCFTRAVFPRAYADLDIDGDVDAEDFSLRNGCALGPAVPHPHTPTCHDADLDADGRVDLRDFADAALCFSGEAQRPAGECIE